MKFDHLQGFVGVATAGSFRKAAKALCTGQPALTRKIQALEHELGVELFVRSPSGTELTSAGQFLLTRTRAMLTELARTKQDIRLFSERDHGRADVTIAFGTTYALAQVLFSAVARHIERSGVIGIDVRFHEQTTAQLERHLRSGALDVVLTGLLDGGDDYDVVRIGEDPLCLVSAGSRSAGPPDVVSLAEVATLPLVAYFEGHGPRTVMDRHFRLAGHKPSITMEAGTLTTILSHIRHGFGHGVIPLSSMVATGAAGEFRVAQISGMAIPRDLVCRRHRARTETAILKQVILAEAVGFLKSDPRFRLNARHRGRMLAGA